MFSQRLKRLRKEAKKTQADMADYMEINRSTYGEYERGVISPPIEKITLLADYFNVSVDYLIGHTQARMIEMKEDPLDVLQQLTVILEYLKDDDSTLKFDGDPLKEYNRDFLVSQIQSSIKTASTINKSNS